MDPLEIIMKELQIQGKSQVDLAYGIGIAKNTVTNWKNGSSNSYLKMLPQIADYFGVSVDYLLGKTDQKEKPLHEDEGQDDNVIVIRGRDGSYVKKRLTDEQINAMKMMIAQLPEAPDDL